jgi:transposase
MSTDATSLPDDLALSHQIILQQRDELAAIQQKVTQLERRLHDLLRRLYMPRSERMVDPGQMTLFDTKADVTAIEEAPLPVAAETPASATAKPKRKGHGRRRFPEDIERRRIVLDIDEAEKTCPCCGSQRQPIGEVTTERLSCRPLDLFVNQYVQLKYACTCEQSGVVTAEKPIQPIEKGNAEPELVALVAVSRFDDHSPYYRQEHGALRRAGVDLPRSTLCDWMRRIAELCGPLYRLMADRVLLSHLLGTDDTEVPLLVPGRGRTQRAHLWAYRGDRHHPYNVFDFTVTHTRAGPLKFLKRDADSKPEEGYRGYLQADAFAGYNELFRQGDIVEVGCWAHARRKYFEAKESDMPRGLEALARIKQLYEIEAEAKELPAAERLVLRRERSLPLLGAMREWLDAQYARVLPRGAMGLAMNYSLENWAALCRYCEDGEIPIDNNAVERMLRIIAIGRKNWLHAGSERGGETAAVLFTLISSAKRHRLNTWDYLRDVLWRLADLRPGELDELLPDRWRDAPARRPIA